MAMTTRKLERAEGGVEARAMGRSSDGLRTRLVMLRNYNIELLGNS